MSVFYDIFAAAIVIVCGFGFFKRGFVSVIAAVAAFVIGIAVAFALSAPVSNAIYDNYAAPEIEANIAESLNSNFNTESVADIKAAYAENKENLPSLNLIFENIPQWQHMGGNLEIDDIGDSVGDISNKNIKPIVIIPLKALIFYIIFAIISGVLSFGAKALHIVNKIPLIGTVNSLLGLVLGLFNACLIIGLVCIAAHAVIILTGDEIVFVNTQTIAESKLFSIAYQALNF